ncbi:ABC transporter substrate-binding protein [Bradyrhizobium manausense]|uniref:ABC transporter substrate-binding protein n=1 Tax=Bradyrhizobium TaxID=374 RepID=UPI001BAAC30C|nr:MULTISPECIES: ABC transporter substrate-binding protein [Bradyrhizobium]MBR0830346.1 ABC transporter substrate-binding protein [Bradyrhizobium manausense]UVO31639.1 ABC transporter substrate-binding protein [Bradyrhizobium arachidis]
MKRREFIAGTAALLVSPKHAGAQGARRRLGFLAIGDASGQALNQAERVFIDTLRSLGWVEGKNLVFEYRFSHPPDRLTASVADLMGLSPDVLVVAGPQAAIALKSTTATIPIVFVGIADPVGLGLVQSLSRPGGNITGLTTNVPDDFLAKRLEILRELVPGASKIALLVNPDNPMQRPYLAEHIPSIARKLGIALPIVEATKTEELDAAFASAAAQHADAIIDFGDSLTYVQAPRIIALAAKHRLPANYMFRHYANGGLSVYGADTGDLFRRAGSYVDKIFRGAKPSELPVERPTKFELVINMKTAKELGLNVSPSLLVRADEVIE